MISLDKNIFSYLEIYFSCHLYMRIMFLYNYQMHKLINILVLWVLSICGLRPANLSRPHPHTHVSSLCDAYSPSNHRTAFFPLYRPCRLSIPRATGSHSRRSAYRSDRFDSPRATDSPLFLSLGAPTHPLGIPVLPDSSRLRWRLPVMPSTVRSIASRDAATASIKSTVHAAFSILVYALVHNNAIPYRPHT